MVAVVGGAGAIRQHQALEATIIGLPHGGVDADISGDPGEDEVRDTRTAQDQVQVGGVEGSLTGFVDDRFTGQRRDLRDDLPPGFAAHKDASARSNRTDLRARALRTPPLVLRKVDQVGAVPFAGVDHQHSCVATRSEYSGGRREARTGQREVVTHRIDVSAGSAEVDLPVDE